MTTLAKTRTSWRRIVVSWGPVCLIIAAAQLWNYCGNRWIGGPFSRLFFTSAGIVGVVQPDFPFGEAILSYSHRVTLLDPATGRRHGPRVLGVAEPTCAEVDPGLLWCRSGDELVLLELPTLHVRASWAGLKRAVPQLAPGLARDEGPLKFVEGRLLVKTKDGRRWVLHPDPLRASKPAPGAQVVEYAAPSYPTTPGGPPSLPAGLVVSGTAEQSSKSRAVVSRVDEAGRVLWTRDLGVGRVRLAVVAGGAYVIVGDLPGGVAIGLDPASGRVRWRSRF